jgi:DNA (cytosine-5)-methyltransferase 1
VNGISLFSGVGGIELDLQEACEVETVAYVEWEPYCQAVLIQRMQEGLLTHAPIYDDVSSFRGEKYRGKVDIVFGGFPCQDISNAGKGAGIKEGTRSGLWFEMLRIIGEVRPEFIFLENVSAITRRGLCTVLGGLVEAGYDCRYTTLQAADVGARHRRERWFCIGWRNI